MDSPKAEIDSTTIEKIVNMKLLGLKNIVSVKTEDAVKKGENYGSVLRRLKIKGLQDDGSITHKSLIIKMDHISTDDTDTSKCETQMYSEVMPKINVIIDEANASGCKVKLETPWPICYGVGQSNSIILEDLLESGYSMRNRRDPMGPEIAVYVGSELAKFHALSVTAINRKLIDPDTLQANIFASCNPIITNLWSGGLDELAMSIKSDPQWNYVIPKLEEIGASCGKRVQEIAAKINHEFPVICHGDCWSNNLLFKFSEESTPTSMKFVDYQGSHYGCFAWDLIYLMNTSMLSQDRQTCYKPLMENYRRSLVETLEALGQDASSVPQLDRMHTIMDQLNLFALLLAFTFFPLSINTMEKPWSMENALKGNKNTHSPEMYTNPYFKESLKLDLVRFKSQGFF